MPRMTWRNDSGLAVLAGAGPGEPGLATRATLEWLSKADVVIYDRLANPALLALAPDGAERIDVGKTPGRPGPSQEHINNLLIEKCRSGRLVVRLKGGDPMTFGRGGEEAEALAAAGCRFRIVPGVTAAAAAAAYAGIPLTDRRLASGVVLVTGHQEAAKGRDAIDFAALARIDTVVFYMPVGNLAEIAERLMAAGRDARTPAALIENASRPKQRTIPGTLADIARAARAARVRPPAVLIVGRVVELHDRLTWFEKLPLAGKTVLITRPARQAGRLAARLAELGAAVVQAPAVRIEPPGDFAPLDAALGRLGQFDWLVLTSANGAEAVLARMGALGLDARALGGVKIAVVGPATAEALAEKFVTADLVPPRFTTESLAETLTGQPLAGRSVLLARSETAAPGLPEALRRAGASVEQAIAYRAVCPAELPDAAAEALRKNEVDWIAFTSSSTVANLLTLAGRRGIDLSGTKLAAIGPVTAEAIEAAGLVPAVVADPHTADGLAEAVATAAND